MEMDSREPEPEPEPERKRKPGKGCSSRRGCVAAEDSRDGQKERPAAVDSPGRSWKGGDSEEGVDGDRNSWAVAVELRCRDMDRDKGYRSCPSR